MCGLPQGGPPCGVYGAANAAVPCAPGLHVRRASEYLGTDPHRPAPQQPARQRDGLRGRHGSRGRPAPPPRGRPRAVLCLGTLICSGELKASAVGCVAADGYITAQAVHTPAAACVGSHAWAKSICMQAHVSWGRVGTLCPARARRNTLGSTRFSPAHACMHACRAHMHVVGAAAASCFALQPPGSVHAACEAFLPCRYSCPLLAAPCPLPPPPRPPATASCRSPQLPSQGRPQQQRGRRIPLPPPPPACMAQGGAAGAVA